MQYLWYTYLALHTYDVKQGAIEKANALHYFWKAEKGTFHGNSSSIENCITSFCSTLSNYRSYYYVVRQKPDMTVKAIHLKKMWSLFLGGLKACYTLYDNVSFVLRVLGRCHFVKSFVLRNPELPRGFPDLSSFLTEPKFVLILGLCHLDASQVRRTPCTSNLQALSLRSIAWSSSPSSVLLQIHIENTVWTSPLTSELIVTAAELGPCHGALGRPRRDLGCHKRQEGWLLSVN